MDRIETKGVWVVDPVHSKIRFEARHLLITSVSGWFTEFEGTVITQSEEFNDSSINLIIYTNSLYTGNKERDTHLRSEDFFNTKHFPTMNFISRSFRVKEKDIEVVGDLKIKDVNEIIEFTVTHIGSAHDPLGNVKAGFEMSTTINRKDFGISWNQVFDQARVLLSDEVKIFCDIQLLRVSC